MKPFYLSNFNINIKSILHKLKSSKMLGKKNVVGKYFIQKFLFLPPIFET